MKKILFISLILLISCKYSSKNKSDEALARVYDEYLYKSDLAGLLPFNSSVKDSITLSRNYINNWIRQKLILHKAESNLSNEQKDFKKQLEDYRNSLIIYKYESELIKQKLDTIVDDTAIQDYYNKHKKNFELKDNIVKVRFIILNIDTPVIKKLNVLLKTDNEDDLQQLSLYCQQHSEQYFLDDEKWLFFNDILKKIPIRTYKKELYLKNHKYIELKDTLYHYFVYIKNFMTKGNITPLSFEKENIRNTIINKRKLKLIKQMQNDVFENAIKTNDFEIY